MSAIEVEVKEGLKIEAKAPTASNAVVTDAPKEMGGGGLDMSPTDLFAVSLINCMLTMMGLAAKKVGADITGAKGEVTKTMVMQPVMRISAFKIHISVPTTVDEGTRAKLEEAATHCPVHQTLSPECKQDITFSWGQ